MTTKRFFLTFGVNLYLNVAYQLAILQIEKSRDEGAGRVCCSATRGLGGTLSLDGVRRGSNMSAHCRKQHVGHCWTPAFLAETT